MASATHFDPAAQGGSCCTATLLPITIRPRRENPQRSNPSPIAADSVAGDSHGIPDPASGAPSGQPSRRQTNDYGMGAPRGRHHDPDRRVSVQQPPDSVATQHTVWTISLPDLTSRLCHARTQKDFPVCRGSGVTNGGYLIRPGLGTLYAGPFSCAACPGAWLSLSVPGTSTARSRHGLLGGSGSFDDPPGADVAASD